MALKPPGPVQAKPYGEVPPLGVRLIEPVLAPKQATSTWVSLAASAAAGWAIATVRFLVQPFASVTVTV